MFRRYAYLYLFSIGVRSMCNCLLEKTKYCLFCVLQGYEFRFSSLFEKHFTKLNYISHPLGFLTLEIMF